MSIREVGQTQCHFAGELTTFQYSIMMWRCSECDPTTLETCEDCVAVCKLENVGGLGWNDLLIGR